MAGGCHGKRYSRDANPFHSVEDLNFASVAGSVYSLCRMTTLNRVKHLIWQTCHRISPALEHRLKRRFSKSCWDNWGERTRQAMACPDNAFISRVAEAGQVRDGVQIMHNGIKVRLGSYYGQESIDLLKQNRGVHEPQEERVFQEVLKQIPPGGVMIELGAYWGYYSMWFCREVKDAKVFLVEPTRQNLDYGRENFALNGLQGHFTQAWVGQVAGIGEDGIPVLCVDDFVASQRLDRLSILHADIQGFEMEMLKGAAKTLAAQKVSFTFISTHSEELHAECERFLQANGYQGLASVPPSESYSMDGILVHRAPQAPAIAPVQLSRRSTG